MNVVQKKIIKYSCGKCGVDYDEFEQATMCCIDIEYLTEVAKKYKKLFNKVYGSPFNRRDFKQFMVDLNKRSNELQKIRLELQSELRKNGYDGTPSQFPIVKDVSLTAYKMIMAWCHRYNVLHTTLENQKKQMLSIKNFEL